MTLSEAKARSKSVIDTLRSLGVPDAEIRHRLVSNMQLAPAFVDNQLACLLPPPKIAEVNRRKQAPLFRPGLSAEVFKRAGMNLFDKPHMNALRDELLNEGHSLQQVYSAFACVRKKVREMKL